MSQLQEWEREYITGAGVPTTTREEPSSSVVNSIKLIRERKLLNGNKAVDLGCGVGRNTLYLAQQGFDVMGVDFVQVALDKFLEKSVKQGLAGKVSTVNSSIATKLPFGDNEFDLALDITASVSLSQAEISVFSSEVKRILKPSGLFISYVLGKDDEYFSLNGNKDGYIVVPAAGIVDYYRSEDELRRIYQGWEFLKMEKIEKSDQFFGKEYTRRLWWMIFKNDKS